MLKNLPKWLIVILECIVILPAAIIGMLYGGCLGVHDVIWGEYRDWTDD